MVEMFNGGTWSFILIMGKAVSSITTNKTQFLAGTSVKVQENKGYKIIYFTSLTVIQESGNIMKWINQTTYPVKDKKV